MSQFYFLFLFFLYKWGDKDTKKKHAGNIFFNIFSTILNIKRNQPLF